MATHIVVGNLALPFEDNPTKFYFCVIPLDVYDSILGMNWPKTHSANICCHNGAIAFLSLGCQVKVEGTIGKPKTALVKAKKLLRGLRKNQPIYLAVPFIMLHIQY